MLAAKTASALPFVIASCKCSRFPAPPDAIRGIFKSVDIVLSISRSNPSLVPSLSILVSRISPAPLFWHSIHQSYADSILFFLPPCVKTKYSLSIFLTSTAITIHCRPIFSVTSLIIFGLDTAAVFIVTLSAPTDSKSLTSLKSLTPPPTVNGINTSLATFSTTLNIVSLPSCDAVISKNVISSAPSESYFFATSTGSPASTISTKFVPFTTRPLSTSKQGIILLATLIDSLRE